MIFRRPHGKEAYCLDEMDPTVVLGVADFRADNALVKWRDREVCSRKDGLKSCAWRPSVWGVAGGIRVVEASEEK